MRVIGGDPSRSEVATSTPLLAVDRADEDRVVRPLRPGNSAEERTLTSGALVTTEMLG